MRYIPCIICNNIVEEEDTRIIAKVCDNCNKGNLTNILKKIDYKNIKAIINNQSVTITKNGELI